MQCKHCLKEFTGGASRIREHYVYSTPACGVSQCEKVPADVLALMQQEHAKRVREDELSAAKRALEMATCSTAAAAAAAAAAVAVGGSTMQKTLFQCARGASKAECDEAVARMCTPMA